MIDHAPELEEECRRRWPDLRVIPNRARTGLLRRAQHGGGGEHRGGRRLSRRRRGRRDRDWIERLGADLHRPPSARRRRRGQPPLAGRAARAGSRPSSTGSSAARTPACRRSASRSATWSAPTCRSGARRCSPSAASATSWAGSARTPPAARRPTSASASPRAGRTGSILYDPAPAVEHFVPPERGELAYFITRCCRARAARRPILARLVGSESGLSAERSYVPPHAAAGRPARPGEGLQAATLAASPRATMIVTGLATTVAGYVAAPRALGSTHVEKPGTGEHRPLRVLTVTPRSPLAQGGVERHVMEVTRRLAAAGAEVEVLCTEPGGPRLHEEERDGVEIRTCGPGRRTATGAWRRGSGARSAAPSPGTSSTCRATTRWSRRWRCCGRSRCGIPYVVTFHGGGHSSGAAQPPRAALQRRLLRPLLRRAATAGRRGALRGRGVRRTSCACLPRSSP